MLPRMEATRMTEKAVVQTMSSVFQALTMDNMPLDADSCNPLRHF